jgi:hypothetical protein
MSTATEFAQQALTSFRSQLAERRQLLDRAAEDVGVLIEVGAMDSFVSTFLETKDSLLTTMFDRLVSGDEPFAKQLESSNDPLVYVDHNGCQWLFDVRKPHLGWV